MTIQQAVPRTPVLQRAAVGFFGVCTWIYRLALLNLLWLAGTLLGLGVAGLFPATLAGYTVCRGWLRTERSGVASDDRSVPQQFFEAYRSGFGRANGFGWVLASAAVLAWADLRFFAAQPGSLGQLGLITAVVLAVLVGLMLVYGFPIYAHRDVSWHRAARLAILFGLAHPVRTLLAPVAGFSFFVIFLRVPGLVIFFGFSVFACFVMWLTLRGFDRHDRLTDER